HHAARSRQCDHSHQVATVARKAELNGHKSGSAHFVPKPKMPLLCPSLPNELRCGALPDWIRPKGLVSVFLPSCTFG
ncbi:MAG: hypothetical protein ABSG56_34865, partial [Bryobacteraceae bacterium]